MHRHSTGIITLAILLGTGCGSTSDEEGADATVSSDVSFGVADTAAHCCSYCIPHT